MGKEWTSHLAGEEGVIIGVIFKGRRGLSLTISFDKDDTIVYLKILVLLYADDTVELSGSEASFQTCLNTLGKIVLHKHLSCSISLRVSYLHEKYIYHVQEQTNPTN